AVRADLRHAARRGRQGDRAGVGPDAAAASIETAGAPAAPPGVPVTLTEPAPVDWTRIPAAIRTPAIPWAPTDVPVRTRFPFTVAIRAPVPWPRNMPVD